MSAGSQCVSSYGQTTSSSLTDPTSSASGRRPAALHTAGGGVQSVNLSGTSATRYRVDGDDQYGRTSAPNVDQQQYDTPTYGVSGSVQYLPDRSNVADLTRANLAEHSAGQFAGAGLGQSHHHQQQLGSQSTLASDRGGGARLLQTSHDPTHYSMSQQATSSSSTSGGPRSAADTVATGSGGAGGSGGSPIWKRRYASSVAGGRSAAGHSPASNDDTYSDGSGDGSSNAAAATALPPPQKQRVTFRIPPSAYIETEDTDC